MKQREVTSNRQKVTVSNQQRNKDFGWIVGKPDPYVNISNQLLANEDSVELARATRPINNSCSVGVLVYLLSYSGSVFSVVLYLDMKEEAKKRRRGGCDLTDC